MSRRAFLRRAAAAGIALPGATAILAACSADMPTGSVTASEGANPYGVGGVPGAPYPLARSNAPVTWHVDETRMVPSDARPERHATLKVLHRPFALPPLVVSSFEERYGCTVERTEFADIGAALATIDASEDDHDAVIGMNVWALARSIAAGRIRPLNLDHVPNLSSNCWGSFQSPFYDVGSRYSAPYSVWSTGIFWRSDKLPVDVAAMDNPYDVFWTESPPKRTHLLSDARDVLSMAMFRDGLTDVNDVDEQTVRKAKDAIAEIVDATNASFDHEESLDVTKGRAWLHQSSSGSVGAAFASQPTAPVVANLSYLWPVDAGAPGSVDNDLLVVLDRGRAPVLAHLLLNHVLDAGNAMRSLSAGAGSQMPQKTLTRDALVGAGLVPEHLANVLLLESDMERGSRQLELPAEMDAVWRSAYEDLQARG